MKTKYTLPEICPAHPNAGDMSKEWRIRFKYFDDNTRKNVLFTFKKGINRFHSFKERLAEAIALKNALKYKLEHQQWNPITDTYGTPSINTDDELENLKYITFREAIEFAYKKKLGDWGPKSASDYKSTKKYLQKAAAKLNLDQKMMSEFELPHYRMIIDQVAADRKLSASGYNKYRENLGTLVTEMKQWKIVRFNEAYEVKSKAEPKKMAHRPPTQDQRTIIINRIKQVNYPYYVFLCILYGCTLRPKEILNLKVADFHKNEGVFRLRSEEAKNHTERDVTIPLWLMDELMKLNLHAYKPDDYIFSARNKYASFLPGPKRAGRNMATRTWKKIVKDPTNKGGLNMKITQYSLKKLAGNDMIRIQRQRGLDNLLELPKHQMGHASQTQTKVYVTEHLEVFNDLIKNDMPVL